MTEYEELAYIQEEERNSLELREDLVELSKLEGVFWEYGEGLTFRAIVNTEEDFLNFMQKVGLVDIFGHSVPWFVDDSNEFNTYLYYKDCVSTSELDTAEYFDDHCEGTTYFPTNSKNVWCATYNQYFDKPFRLQKKDVRLYTLNDVGVKPEFLEKLPAMLTFYSENTFDRMGDIEGHNFKVVQMKNLQNVPIPD
jgi:hypothetical protein